MTAAPDQVHKIILLVDDEPVAVLGYAPKVRRAHLDRAMRSNVKTIKKHWPDAFKVDPPVEAADGALTFGRAVICFEHKQPKPKAPKWTRASASDAMKRRTKQITVEVPRKREAEIRAMIEAMLDEEEAKLQP